MNSPTQSEQFKSVLAVARRLRKTQREVLRRYGKHESGCPLNQEDKLKTFHYENRHICKRCGQDNTPPPICTCGLDAALTDTPPIGKDGTR